MTLHYAGKHRAPRQAGPVRRTGTGFAAAAALGVGAPLAVTALNAAPAMANGGGRRRRSSAMLTVDAVDAMLEVDRFRLWPREWPPWVPIVDARERLPGGRTRSVRIWRWKRVLVAASESPGMSSLTWTVWACWRRLSSREKRREQWHWNGRSPVCFLRTCQSMPTQARISRWAHGLAHLM